jgi:hypothetical protein
VRDSGSTWENARTPAIERVRSHVTWGPEFGNSPFFEATWSRASTAASSFGGAF